MAVVSAFSEPPSERRGDHAIAQINITPLIDVMLVLLIIFMVATPILSTRLDLRLPQPGPDTGQKPPPRLTLEVLAGDSYRLAGQALRRDELQPALDAQAARVPTAILEIAASGDADYQGFARALSAARNSGIEHVALAP
ncbi:ExbD/TolR family protein [Lysobacter koreensis]|uniref:ExbD/TolR family protein n=1 Tax=Lysobacter koreensis TaxID=266122 RepID=A0ABW2YNN4_9GAMM